MRPGIKLAVDLLASATYGHVFVFNMWNEDMDHFSVNGKDLGPIPGADKPPYTPSSIQVPRVLNQSDGLGAFANKGTNQVVVQWLGDPIDLPPIKLSTVPLSEDLLLYLLPFGFYLVNVNGDIKAQGTFSTDGVA